MFGHSYFGQNYFGDNYWGEGGTSTAVTPVGPGVAVASGSITGTGATTSFQVWGVFDVFILGTFTATIRLEMSFDDGSNWIPAAAATTGTTASYTAPVSISFKEIEDGMLYRLNCTAFTSGIANWRIAQGKYRLRF